MQGKAWQVAVLIGVLALAGRGGSAQEACSPPPVVLNTPGSNIFTEQQEIDLGDAAAEQLDRTFRETSDAAVTAELQRIGDRLAKHLPPNQFKLRYLLIDLSIPQGLSFPGGRIYISRKMAAFVRNEDEMAAVIAHELGHIVTHQGAVRETRLLKQVLAVTELGDRRDVFDEFRQLSENWRRNPKAFRAVSGEGEEKELVADQVALYAMTSAGYAPQSFADIFDRVAQTQGRTGSWLSDIFHTTPPSQRRLRAMLDAVQRMPQACVDREPHPPVGEFHKWQDAVVAYTGWDNREALHGVLATVQLQPPLRQSVTHLKFSPDGKYLLAQDASKIYVLTVRPLSYVFDFDAPTAKPAQFTPDSKAIAFVTPQLRVETWDVASQKKTGAFEPVVPKGCTLSELAPDGKTLGCISADRTLTLLDVASGATLLEKPSFATELEFFNLKLGAVGALGFSPDGQYFLASSQSRALAFDIANRVDSPLHGALKSSLGSGFAFSGPDRVIGKPAGIRGLPASLIDFPSGKILGHVSLGVFPFTAATHGDYLLVKPFRFDLAKPVKSGEELPAVEVVDLGTGKVSLADKRPGLDVYDPLFARGMLDGEVGLYQMQGRALQAQAKLPASSVQSLRAQAISPDLQWLAVSEKDRGAVWNLRDGKQLYATREFDGAWFSSDGPLYCDYPAFQGSERSIAKLSLSGNDISVQSKVDEPYAQQHGRYLVVTTPKRNGFDRLNSDVTREVRDVQTGATVWSRDFPHEAPSLGIEPEEGAMTLGWPASARAAEDEIKQFPALEQRLSGAKDKRWIDFLEVINLPSGKPLGALLIDTNKGSFRIADVFSVADWVMVTDNQQAVQVYSLSTGEKIGEVAGALPTVSKSSGVMSVKRERAQLVLYDLHSLDQLDQFVFSSPIVTDRFSQDGKRLFVLTADQTTYFLDVSGPTRPEPPPRASPAEDTIDPSLL